MKQKQKSLVADTKRKKRRILMGCLIGSATLIMVGAGIGIGYAIWHSKNTPPTPYLSANIPADNLKVGTTGTATIKVTEHNVAQWEDLSVTSADGLSVDPFIANGLVGTAIVNLDACNAGGDYSLTIAQSSGSDFAPITQTIHVDDELVDYHVIDNNVETQYLISETTPVYTSNSVPVATHAKLLDLQKYATAHNIEYSNFVIKGTVDFGILVGFNQSVRLYGEGGGTIKLLNQTNSSYGVIVGSTDEPVSGNDSYTGNMYIDSSLKCDISSSSASAYGVYFGNTVAGSTQTINGTFTVSTSSSSDAYGVYFGNTVAGSTQTINGTFEVFGYFAYGVFFNGGVAGSTTINGTFEVSSSDAYGVYFFNTAAGSTQTINGTFAVSSSYDGYGVYFESTAAGSATINGTFAVSSSADAYGVRFNGTAAGSATINGTFAVSSSYDGYGVYFESAAAGSTQTINGTFTVSSSNDLVCGVYFNNTAAGSTQTINGTFTVFTSSSSFAYGVRFYDSTAAGSTTINGTFTVSSSSASAYGVYFQYPNSVTMNFQSNNQFTLISNTSVYSCNQDLGTMSAPNRMKVFGRQTVDSSASSNNYADYTIDGNIALVTYNTSGWSQLRYQVHTNPDVYFFMYFARTAPFDGPASTGNRMKLALQNYIQQSSAPTVGKTWIEEILEAFA